MITSAPPWRAGDFNGDGYSDLAIAVRNEAIGSIARAGAVNVLYGSPGGLRIIGDQIFHQNTPRHSWRVGGRRSIWFGIGGGRL